MATTTFQKLFGNLSANKNVKNLVSDFQKLSKELRQKGTKLNSRLNSTKNEKIHQAYGQYKKLVTLVGHSQKQLDQEVEKALSLIKRSAADVEKNLKTYRKKAVAQTVKIEKAIMAQSKTSSKTSSKKATKKKTTRKATKKTSRKTA